MFRSGQLPAAASRSRLSAAAASIETNPLRSRMPTSLKNAPITMLSFLSMTRLSRSVRSW